MDADLEALAKKIGAVLKGQPRDMGLYALELSRLAWERELQGNAVEGRKHPDQPDVPVGLREPHR